MRFPRKGLTQHQPHHSGKGHCLAAQVSTPGHETPPAAPCQGCETAWPCELPARGCPGISVDVRWTEGCLAPILGCESAEAGRSCGCTQRRPSWGLVRGGSLLTWGAVAAPTWHSGPSGAPTLVPAFNRTLLLAGSTLQSGRSSQLHAFPPPSPSRPRLPVYFLFAVRASCASSFILAIFQHCLQKILLCPPSVCPGGLCTCATHQAHPPIQCAFLLFGCGLLRERAAWWLVTGLGPHRSWLAGQVVRNGRRLLRVGVELYSASDSALQSRVAGQALVRNRSDWFRNQSSEAVPFGLGSALRAPGPQGPDLCHGQSVL